MLILFLERTKKHNWFHQKLFSNWDQSLGLLEQRDIVKLAIT